MVIEVTKDDLRRALSVNKSKRNSSNCVLAQAIKRQTGINKVQVAEQSNVVLVGNKVYKETIKITKMVNLFDVSCKLPQLRKRLSNSLPTKVRLISAR